MMLLLQNIISLDFAVEYDPHIWISFHDIGPDNTQVMLVSLSRSGSRLVLEQMGIFQDAVGIWQSSAQLSLSLRCSDRGVWACCYDQHADKSLRSASVFVSDVEKIGCATLTWLMMKRCERK